LCTWLLYRSEYLDEFAWDEGRGARRLWDDKYHCCGLEGPQFRCRDQQCFGGELFCGSCQVKAHQTNPLHWMEWIGMHFKRTSLQDMGLVVQLGHTPGLCCMLRGENMKKVTVIHTNSVHGVSVDFCSCGTEEVEHWRQMMWTCWWPATLLEPQTCSTFEVLWHFQSMNCLGKVSGYDYY
ncbi:hypothetical protein C8J57DRAFT_1095056, partial [Mycena rebaudengoi]